ncbi:MAG TPA: acyltransferase [Pyrinomonadaceae bacterium]|nr:acyltransferase [Pyrinomonadaceae bacterium]
MQRNIPSLDGLRAVSISLVILSHVVIAFVPLLPPRGLPAATLSLLELGHLGVTVFFVISGFLITSLLLREERINLSEFYFRRTLRIFPPYYFYLLVILALTLAGYLQISGASLLAAFTYTTNYFIYLAAKDYWYVAHGWSLAVEEQFYLLWPATLLLLGRRRALWAIGFVLAACPLIRLIYKLHDPSLPTDFYTFETVADSLASGCLLAVSRAWLHERSWYQRALQSSAVGLSAPTAALLIHLLGKFPVLLPSLLFVGIGITVQNVCIAFCLDWCVANYMGRAGRILNSRPLVFVGVISYSLYLWQQPFLSPTSSLPLVAKLILVFAAALGSYYLIEKPALRLRRHLSGRSRSRATGGAARLADV